jgi:hypothetical protein
VISFDQLGPLSLRPTHGSGWAGRRRPERHRATFSRRHGVRYGFGALDVHRDRLRLRLMRRRRGQDTLSFMRQLRLCCPRRIRLYWVRDKLSANWTPTSASSPPTTTSSSSRFPPTPATSTGSRRTSGPSPSLSSTTPTTSTGTPSPTPSPTTSVTATDPTATAASPTASASSPSPPDRWSSRCDIPRRPTSECPGSSARRYAPCRSAHNAIMPILSVAAMFSSDAPCPFAILTPVSVAEADDGRQAQRPAFP